MRILLRSSVTTPLLAFAILASPTAGAQGDAAREEAAVRKVAYTFVGWALDDKNKDALLACPSHGDDFFMFQPDSTGTVQGYEAFTRLVPGWMDPDFRATRTEIRDMKVGVSESGDTAWFSCLLDDCGEYRGRPSCWKDCRYSGVLAKREGRWVIVQAHFSLASDKVVEDHAKSRRDPVVQYLANEGILFRNAGLTVLVDFPWSGTFDWCESASEERIQALLDGRPPFDRVDALIFTHDHVDHFDPALVAKLLLRHPETSLVGTSLVLKRVRDSAGSGLTNPTHEAVAGTPVSLGSIRVLPLAAPHAPYGDGTIDPETGKPNVRRDGYVHLAYRIDLAGTSVIHCGDALDIAWPAITSEKDKPALLMLDRGFVRAKGIPALAELRRATGAGRVALMHVGPKDQSPVRTIVKDESAWLSAFATPGEVIRLPKPATGGPTDEGDELPGVSGGGPGSGRPPGAGAPRASARPSRGGAPG